MSLRTTSCLASSVMVDDGLRVAMSARGSHRGKTSGAQNRPIITRAALDPTHTCFVCDRESQSVRFFYRLWQTNFRGNGDLSESPHVLTRHTLVYL